MEKLQNIEDIRYPLRHTFEITSIPGDNVPGHYFRFLPKAQYKITDSGDKYLLEILP